MCDFDFVCGKREKLPSHDSALHFKHATQGICNTHYKLSDRVNGYPGTVDRGTTFSSTLRDYIKLLNNTEEKPHGSSSC